MQNLTMNQNVYGDDGSDSIPIHLEALLENVLNFVNYQLDMLLLLLSSSKLHDRGFQGITIILCVCMVE